MGIGNNIVLIFEAKATVPMPSHHFRNGNDLIQTGEKVFDQIVIDLSFCIGPYDHVIDSLALVL